MDIGGRYQNKNAASESVLLTCTFSIPPPDDTLATHMATDIKSSFVMVKWGLLNHLLPQTMIKP